MEKVAYHNSHEEKFRNPFGAVTCGTKISLGLEVDHELPVEKVQVRLWLEGGEELVDMKPLADRDGTYSRLLYQAVIQAPSEPGLLWYYFIIHGNQETIYWGNNEHQLGGEGQLYKSPPLSYQITAYLPGTQVPRWFTQGIMYQIFVDRFYNGCEDGRVLNPKKDSLIHAHWDNDPVYIRDSEGRVINWDFFGGNLLGVLKKLPYLCQLGVNIIYLNPIFESPSNHKYDTADYKRIDPMFGDEEILETLCKVAEAMGIKIILDGVFSHTGSDSRYFNREGNYPELGAYQSKESPYYNWYRFHQHPDQYESWWGIDTMPNVEELEPSYLDFIIRAEDSVVKKWMGKGIRGWRLDVVDELPDEFVKLLYNTAKEVNPEAVVIGEVWEDASNKVSYDRQREYLWGEELDSVMNYPLRGSLIQFMLGHIDAYQCHCRLMSLKENYPEPYFYATMNMLGTHDVPRILTIMAEGVGCEAKCKAVERVKLLTIMQFTLPGVPCIYYGDEAGLEGVDDPDCRKTHPWENGNKDLYNWYEQLAHIRRDYPVFIDGDWISLPLSAHIYGYIRSGVGNNNKGETAVVLINRSDEEAVVDASQLPLGTEASLRNLISGTELNSTHLAVLKLKPLQGLILYSS
ncbi:4-alpha-glucanotransferase [Desulfitispora alkaliphila]|uniref:glycoside hydrolase family 13 protein n=1 Tax=Desulfitispora alkaliphila TaxID=622674 RepID=UPI003D246ACF